MFLVVLEGMVYTVGAIFAAAALYLGKKIKKNITYLVAVIKYFI